MSEDVVVPPFRYAMVEEGVARSAFPRKRNFTFLKRLHLRTIVSLIPEGTGGEISQFCTEQGIKWITFDVPKFKDEPVIKKHLLAKIVKMLVYVENQPLLVHCLDGTHATGLVIMGVRKLQHWNLSFIFGEFNRFSRELSTQEAGLIESWKGEVRIKGKIPPWLWDGQPIRKHPTVKIIYEKEESGEVQDGETAVSASILDEIKTLSEVKPLQALERLIQGAGSRENHESRVLDALDLQSSIAEVERPP